MLTGTVDVFTMHVRMSKAFGWEKGSVEVVWCVHRLEVRVSDRVGKVSETTPHHQHKKVTGSNIRTWHLEFTQTNSSCYGD